MITYPCHRYLHLTLKSSIQTEFPNIPVLVILLSFILTQQPYGCNMLANCLPGITSVCSSLLTLCNNLYCKTFCTCIKTLKPTLQGYIPLNIEFSILPILKLLHILYAINTGELWLIISIDKTPNNKKWWAHVTCKPNAILYGFGTLFLTIFCNCLLYWSFVLSKSLTIALNPR